MELCEKICCKLCFNNINDNNFTVIEETLSKVLNALLLKLDVKGDTSSVICNACCTKILEAFQFKSNCLETEDNILRYVNLEIGEPMDLLEIYLNMRDKKYLRSVLEDEIICRLCMQIYTHGFTPVKDLESDLTCKYLLEMNFNATKEPVVCSSCFNSLMTHWHFLKNCLDVQDKVICTSELEDSPFCIKTEEIEIKSEEDEIRNISDCDAKLRSGETSQSRQLTHEDRPIQYQKMREGTTDTQIYKCDTCGHIAKMKHHLKQHQLIHKDISQVPMYTCESCNFTSKYKECLANHLLRHKTTSEVQMYTCDKCEFQTKYKKSLTTHQLVHKNVSEVRMYTCDTCDYGTKYKVDLARHKQKHKDVSEVQMYKCHKCCFVTKHKTSLDRHKLRHKDVSKVRMYKCDACSYVTKHKCNLSVHTLKHRDVSEMGMYTCDLCGYRAKRKRYLVRHQLVHKHISEGVRYKCDVCNFESKHKQALNRHTLRHKDIS